MDILELLNRIRDDGSLRDITRNPLAQFGVPERRYLGAELLPEREVTENRYAEENIRYRTLIANDGSRYSPVQRKKGELVGAVDVVLGDSDIGREFTGREYDVLKRILGTKTPFEAAPALLNWVDLALNRALIELNEKQRWELMVNAEVIRKGNNGFRETLSIPNPAGHRVNAAGTWSSNLYDPYADIAAMVNLLTSKGYTVNRIITRRAVISILMGNSNIAQRLGITTLAPGVLAGVKSPVLDITGLNNIFQRDGLPPIEEYNLQYNTSAGAQYFLPGNTMVFLCTTGRDETIFLGNDTLRTVQNTFGYLAVGLATAQNEPGRIVNLFHEERRPPRIEGEGYQATCPVITEPEAIGVIKNIS